MSESMERKLTTILCADARGYSRLMDDDEVATFATLKDHREAMSGLISRHRGRIVNTAGDGLMAEFPSVVEAVQCAAEIQRELGRRNDSLETARRMDFRIGINLGDVMVDGDDLFGEGVNIASRLEGLATAGGICISGTAYDQVHNKLSLGYEFMGKQAVKNIAGEIPVYRIDLDGNAPSRRGDAGRETKTSETGTGTGRATNLAADGLFEFLRPIKRMAMRCGFLFAVLLVINLVTSPGYLWSFWAALGILLWLGWKSIGNFDFDGDDDADGREITTSRVKIGGDHTFHEDANFRGRIRGNVRVRQGVRLRYQGKIGGDLILEPGCDVAVRGKIKGDVINQGATFQIKGELRGSERRETGDGK